MIGLVWWVGVSRWVLVVLCEQVSFIGSVLVDQCEWVSVSGLV